MWQENRVSPIVSVSHSTLGRSGDFLDLLARADLAREERRRPVATTNTGNGRRVDRSRVVTQRMADLPRHTTQVGHHRRKM